MLETCIFNEGTGGGGGGRRLKFICDFISEMADNERDVSLIFYYFIMNILS